MKRAILIVLSVLALVVWCLWWVAAFLLSRSGESACQDSLSADLAFVAACLGGVLALAALVTAIPSKTLHLPSWLLSAFALLLGASFVVWRTCG